MSQPNGYICLWSGIAHKRAMFALVCCLLRIWKQLRVRSHGVPNHFRSICAILDVKSMEVGICHFNRIPSVIWMPTWQYFLEVTVGNWLKDRSSKKKLDPTLNRSPVNTFA